MKRGSVITSWRVNGRIWNGNIHNRPAIKRSKSNHPQENWCLQSFGTHKARTGTLSGEGRNNKQYAVTWDAYWQAEACNSKQTPRTTVEMCSVVARQCPYTAAHIAETLRKLKFEIMAHPTYSPDLAPSDYYLFGPLKETLRGRRITSGQELKEAVHALLAA